MFEGIWIPLVTPFRHGTVDTAALTRLVHHYQDAGVNGFVALGTTGEAALLSHVERYTVLETIADACSNRTPFVIGIGAPDTREMVSQLRHYERWQSAGYLVPPPYYVCPSQAGLRWHFSQIAAGTERPIVLYNVACVYANAYEIDEAVEALHLALDNGYAHKEWIQNDHDLDPLRDHPRFKELLERLE